MNKIFAHFTKKKKLFCKALVVQGRAISFVGWLHCLEIIAFGKECRFCQNEKMDLLLKRFFLPWCFVKLAIFLWNKYRVCCNSHTVLLLFPLAVFRWYIYLHLHFGNKFVWILFLKQTQNIINFLWVCVCVSKSVWMCECLCMCVSVKR